MTLSSLEYWIKILQFYQLIRLNFAHLIIVLSHRMNVRDSKTIPTMFHEHFKCIDCIHLNWILDLTLFFSKC